MGYEVLLICIVFSFLAGYSVGQEVLKRSNNSYVLYEKQPKIKKVRYIVDEYDDTIYDNSQSWEPVNIGKLPDVKNKKNL